MDYVKKTLFLEPILKNLMKHWFFVFLLEHLFCFFLQILKRTHERMQDKLEKKWKGNKGRKKLKKENYVLYEETRKE